MKRNHKKIIIILILIAVILFPIILFFIIPRPAPERIKVMLNDNKEDYERIAEMCLEDFLKYEEEKVFYVYLKNDGQFRGTFYTSEGKDLERCFSISEDETISYYNVEESYDKERGYLGGPLELIDVYDTFVSFGNMSGGGAIIYSLNDTKPQYLSYPDEDLKGVVVRKITKHWYYATSENLGI